MAKEGSKAERPATRQAILVLGSLLVMTVLPIGIHTVLLDNLGVPYPAALPKTGWPTIPDHALLILGLICCDNILRRQPSNGLVRRWIYLFLIVGALNQALLRLPIMRNVVSTKWTIYPFIDNLPVVLWFAVAVTLITPVGYVASRVWHKLGLAAVFAILLDLIVAPFLATAFKVLIESIASREGDQLYSVPYDWHVDVPSYLTYLEPAFAALAAALLLRRSGVKPFAIVALLFALQAGPMFRVLLNMYFAPLRPAMAILSEGQFTLEALALSMLSAAFAVVIVNKLGS